MELRFDSQPAMNYWVTSACFALTLGAPAPEAEDAPGSWDESGAISSKIKWSRDGLGFEDAGDFPNQSTGLFTPDESAYPSHRHGFDGGLEVYAEDGARGLRRFDCWPQSNRGI